MTPSTDLTATRSASAIRPRRQPGEVATRGPSRAESLQGWPTAVWLAGSAPWIVGLYTGTFDSLSVGSLPSSFLIVGAICFAATLVSLLPIRNLISGPSDALPAGLLATVAIRGGTTMVLMVAALAAGLLDRTAVALPIVLWYMAFLVTDLIVVNRLLTNAFPLSGPASTERTTC